MSDAVRATLCVVGFVLSVWAIGTHLQEDRQCQSERIASWSDPAVYPQVEVHSEEWRGTQDVQGE